MHLFSTCRASLLVGCLVCIAKTSNAQTDSTAVPFSREIVYGVEIGYGSAQELGSFTQACGCSVSGLMGGVISGGLSAELPITHLSGVGLRAFVQSSHSTSQERLNDTTVVQDPAAGFDTVNNLVVNRTGTYTMTVAGLSPFIDIHPGGPFPFVRFGPSIAVITNSHFKQTHELPSNLLRLPNGSVISNVRFASTGTSSEVVEDRDLTDTKSAVFYASFGAGWEIPLWNFTLSPMVNYDLPLTTIRDTHASNWKIATLYGSLALKFGL